MWYDQKLANFILNNTTEKYCTKDLPSLLSIDLATLHRVPTADKPTNDNAENGRHFSVVLCSTVTLWEIFLIFREILESWPVHYCKNDGPRSNACYARPVDGDGQKWYEIFEKILLMQWVLIDIFACRGE